MFSPYPGTLKYCESLSRLWPQGEVGDFGVAVMASPENWFAIVVTPFEPERSCYTLLAYSPYWLGLMLADLHMNRILSICWMRGDAGGVTWTKEEVQGIYSVGQDSKSNELVIRVRERELYFADGRLADIDFRDLRARPDVDTLFGKSA
ncbi:MAG: hypothetical protein O9337_11605 [Acidovorax sp.]|uniref:hypothetical protein n=1 Tax=Acidovorax sp. TaxID=1872122 RepID=UPI0022CBA65E|nr:hypothetical protein [Acidovorax sp.]MCZ8220058.1 hypothetical protein [Acidovorax sp.]